MHIGPFDGEALFISAMILTPVLPGLERALKKGRF
jgi:hypothetical protein